jgi:RNA polymerase sigma-70 factor, ECF subfamily
VQPGATAEPSSHCRTSLTPSSGQGPGPSHETGRIQDYTGLRWPRFPQFSYSTEIVGTGKGFCLLFPSYLSQQDMKTVTQLLSLLPSGDPQVHGALFSNVYPELKRIAAGHMRFEHRCSRPMQVTALVHEAYLRLAHQQTSSPWRDRLHFFGFASGTMRRILVDQARNRLALKRGGGMADHDLEQSSHPSSIHSPAAFLDLHQALDRLAVIDPRQAQIVEMRFFGGWTEEEIAGALNICSRTVKRDWILAKAWLYGELAR